MACRPFESITFALGLVFATSCSASPTKVGLTNVQAREWRQARQTHPHDVIANGDESCPKVRGGSDPVPVRLYRCPGQMPESRRITPPK